MILHHTGMIIVFAIVYCFLNYTQCVAEIYEDITNEAVRKYSSEFRPLPLTASWNACTWWNYKGSENTAGFCPEWQFEQIREKNYHLIPWFEIPTPEMDENDTLFLTYYEKTINFVKKFKMPILFVGTQWEQILYNDKDFFNLPAEINPNLVDINGALQKRVSPFGGLKAWYDAGKKWGGSRMMQKIIKAYPDPPLIIFASNNEANTLSWREAEISKYFIKNYGYSTSDEFKRKKFVEGWELRYKTLIEGFRAGFKNSFWNNNSRFIAYKAIYPGHFARWDKWKEYSMYTKGMLAPYANFWEGGIGEVYTWAAMDKNDRDNTIQGPLFQAMNFPFLINELLKINQDFITGIILWHGEKDSFEVYSKYGQNFTPQRYKGMAQLAIWITTPRIVFEYDHWDKPRSTNLQWFESIIKSVEEVWNSPILKYFWRKSKLVENTTITHPYQSDVPEEYRHINRMYLLNTNLNPEKPWTFSTEFQVMAICRVHGDKPNRRWLLYAYAPTDEKSNVSVTIPNYKDIIISVAIDGTFYIINECDGKIQRIIKSE